MLTGGTLNDALVTDVSLNWLARQAASKRPFFLNLDLQSSHFPYVLAPKLERPFQPSKIDFEVSFISYPPEKTPTVRNAYNNALHEADRQVGRILEALGRLDLLSGTLIVIYGDHGEAFNEQGLVTHGGAPIEAVARVPCVIYGPAYLAARRDDYPMGLIDVVPTVLVDGFVAATWNVDSRGRLEITPLRRLTRAEHTAIDDEGERLRQFVVD